MSKVDLRLQCGMPCSKLEVSTVQHGTLSGAGYLHQSPENYLVPDIVGLQAIPGRCRNVEDLFEYGSRAGFWRVMRLFEERRLHFTSWAIGLV